MMPFLAWGCFVRSRWLRVLAIGALAGECLDGTILFSSQLSSLYRNFARLNWDLMICYIFLFLALHPVGLFAAIRLYLLELRLYPWEAVPPTVSPLPTYSELAAASPPDSPADRAAWAASASGATAPSAESGRALLFKRLAPWLALLPVLLQAMYVIWLRIDQLVKMVSFDTALSLVLFTALGIGALLAARGQPRWRLWACGVAGWFAVVLFMRNGSMFMMIDSEATYQFFDWADAHGRYNRAWNLFWCLAMAVGLRAIFWRVPRDFAAVGAEGAGGAAVEPEDTVAENAHWDESGPGKKQEG
ncbi:MAG TPA: hypothetical protein VL860_12155 [Planctomycetota bacterium]|nr:hypothetical protein [Planctomycetota bacterium]